MANKHPQRDIRKAPGRPRKLKPNPKQQKFIDQYLITGDVTESARLAGYSENTNVAKGKIVGQSLEEKRKQMEQMFQNAAQDMFINMIELAMESKSDNVRYQASKDLLDRAGFKPVERKELTGSDGNAISLESRITHDLIQRSLALEES